MVFKNLCILVLWRKVASALEGLNGKVVDHICTQLFHHALKQIIQRAKNLVCFDKQNEIATVYLSLFPSLPEWITARNSL